MELEAGRAVQEHPGLSSEMTASLGHMRFHLLGKKENGEQQGDQSTCTHILSCHNEIHLSVQLVYTKKLLKLTKLNRNLLLL